MPPLYEQRSEMIQLNTEEVELTDIEVACLDKIVETWNLYLTLSTLHPDDLLEFRLALHAAQNIILARPILHSNFARG